MAACGRLSRAYVAVGALEKQYAHIQFQGELWIFDTLVIPTLLYRVKTLGPILHEAND